MFSSTTFDSVGFNAVSEACKETGSAVQQTSEIIVRNKGEQSSEVHDKSVQSEPPNLDGEVKCDENKLLEFLNRVTGPLLKELDKIEHSKAFSVQKSNVEDDFSNQNVNELYILRGKPLPGVAQTKVSCISWSCTGSVIAVALESLTHDGWCTHESAVNFYNINLHKFDGKLATNVIQTDACVTSLAMHPNEANIVALGTYSGNVELWSVGRDNRIDGVCLYKEQYHEERITQISWANDSTQQLILITSSLDGRMCIFKNISLGSIQLADKYVLDPESSDVLKPGITCFSFCKQQPGTFIAALESGQLMLCSTIEINTKTNVKRVEKSPILRPLDKKQGIITCVKFSPYEDDIYLVALLNFKISIHSIQKESPVLEIYSDFDILGADWSPIQTKILIAWGTSSKLYVYNQENGKKIKDLVPDDESNNNKYHKAIFNPKSTRLLALAGTDGKTSIWKIPSAFKIPK